MQNSVINKLVFVAAIGILAAPTYRPLHGQDGGGFGADSIDVSGLLGGGGNRGGRGGNNGGGIANLLQGQDAGAMYESIKATLKQGKTPLEKAQEKPLQALLATEVGALNERLQTVRNGIGQAFPAAGNFTGGTPAAGNSGSAQANNQQPSPQTLAIEKVTSAKTDEFLDKKLALFLSPEQVALVQKAKAQDKNNSTCLGGMLDRVSNQALNPGRQNYNNASTTNTKKTNGQSYCMAADATPVQRLEPIRKVLSKGKLPLSKDNEAIAEVFMAAQMKELEDALRSELTGNAGNSRGFNQADIAALFNGGGVNRGGGGNTTDIAALLGGVNRGGTNSNNPQQLIQGSIDNIYKKVEQSLMPAQADTLKRWHYEQMLDRGGVETLIAVEAMQDTPLTDEQITKVTAAWPELRNQIQVAARAANRSLTAKEIDGAAMSRILEMLEPSQVASYQLAKKYGANAAAGR